MRPLDYKSRLRQSFLGPTCCLLRMANALPLCNLNNPAIQYSCSNPYPDCLNPFGFQFSSLWQIANLVAACPEDPRLFKPGQASLTQSACVGFVGSAGFTFYAAADVWSRVTVSLSFLLFPSTVSKEHSRDLVSYKNFGSEKTL